ncbi:MAG TPA: glycosyltransferase [bacterium]|nr:glycosyltransferase [bacterium]
MNIVAISTDKNIFKDRSTVEARMLEYSKLVDSFFVLVFVPKGDNFNNKKIGNLNIFPINYSFKLLSFFNLYFLFKKIQKNNNFNKNNCLILSQDPFEVGFFSWILKKVSGIKLEIQVHNDFLNKKYQSQSIRNFFQMVLGKNILKGANQIRTVSLRSKQSLIENINLNSKKIINLPILFFPKKEETNLLRNYFKEKYPNIKTMILMASRFVKEKNIELAIEVFNKLSEEALDTGLLILGSGPEESAIKKLAQNNKKIFFEGWVNNLSNYYYNADIFLISSNHEGWGMTAVEAASFGLPVIMTDVGCANEFIKNRYNGIVCPVGDKESMYESLKFLVLNKNERERMSQNSLESYKLLTEKNYLQELKNSWVNCLKS